MILEMDVEVVLLDVEGTVCPISFVKDVLFPYALKALDDLLPSNWDSPTFIPYRDAFPSECRTTPNALRAHVHDLVSRDIKDPALKSLQGHLWHSGYNSGEIQCPLFPDVYPALKKWHEAGIVVMIYSSGSVAAQKLLFEHTNTKDEPDLRGYLSGYFDTINAGHKREKDSYIKIGESRSEDIGKWLFLSDQPGEVEAAIQAGMKSLIVMREGNAPLSEEERTKYDIVTSFDKIKIKK